MDAVRLGSLVFPIQVALVVASIVLANAVAAWFRRYRGIDPGPILWKMILAGFVVARLVFVWRHHAIYFSAPLSIVDMRDGGFHALAGFITAFVVGAELTRRAVPLRRPLIMAASAGLLLFAGATVLNTALTPPAAPLPGIDVRLRDGTSVSLSHFAGRPLVINLWATWCPPCRREMPAMMAAQQAHPYITFVFVNQGESSAMVERYLADHGLRMENVVIDPAKQLSARAGASGYPTTLFYDAAGFLQQRHMGELSRATLDEKINGLRAAAATPVRAD
ncbi:MAG: TlpA family protein disulfide reductase [Pseudomonadota bacterium]|nr:TlpA family protein disulfide reductase [Pseudomonadota bacterium]